MPYRDKAKQQEAVKKAMQKKRGITKGITSAVIPDPKGSASPPDVIPIVIPDLPPEWQNVIDFISRPTRKGDISNLEKLQRIAGSLGKLGSHVWMGSLNLEEIGRGIGVKQVSLAEKKGLLGGRLYD